MRSDSEVAPVDTNPPHIELRNLALAYGTFVVQHHIDCRIGRGEVFVIMGGSGCGKSTLLRAMVGLKPPHEGDVLYGGRSFWESGPAGREGMKHRFGVLFQSGALLSSLTLAENVALPLEKQTGLHRDEITRLASLKLALVGLAGFEDYYPSEISGGMQKRAGLARAMALDPEILFFDEPSAGLDPITSRRLDDLILELRDTTGSTVVVVTHELASIFAIADNAIFLDTEERRPLAIGPPSRLRTECPIPRVRQFLNRGDS
jgi:phospholipid/cholesterol/gamma-HCH transport system ATP-binding protein